MRRTAPLVLSLAAAGLVVAALPAQAAHESNNRAELTSALDSGVTGKSIVNYAKGAPNEWKSVARVSGLTPATAYTFTVNGPAGIQEVCSFTTNTRGAGGCTDGEKDLGGFGTAQIRDADGAVVASGSFDRRGGNRVA